MLVNDADDPVWCGETKYVGIKAEAGRRISVEDN